MTAPAQQKPTQKKTKRPSALKRILQSQKRRQRNRSLQASILTAIRKFEASLAQKEDLSAAKENLNLVYSLVDKAVNKGVYKPQKAARTKSRLSTKTH